MLKFKVKALAVLLAAACVGTALQARTLTIMNSIPKHIRQGGGFIDSPYTAEITYTNADNQSISKKVDKASSSGYIIYTKKTTFDDMINNATQVTVIIKKKSNVISEITYNISEGTYPRVISINKTGSRIQKSRDLTVKNETSSSLLVTYTSKEGAQKTFTVPNSGSKSARIKDMTIEQTTITITGDNNYKRTHEFQAGNTRCKATAKP